ncbi:MAG: tRNA methyl transferase PRC-barrel domain-containing protein, partial [Bacteroidia bacterium]
YKKSEIREMARKEGLHDLANKPESYEICFIPDNDYRGFLKRRVEGLEEKVEGGNFVMTDGRVVGKHRGYPFYTIGQRKGLEIALGDPVFVTDIIPETNTVVLGNKDQLMEQSMHVSKLNLIKYASLPDDFQALTKIRYKDPGAMASLTQLNASELEVVFHNSVSAVAPGQSAVFYEGNDLVGGGIIERKKHK